MFWPRLATSSSIRFVPGSCPARGAAGGLALEQRQGAASRPPRGWLEAATTPLLGEPSNWAAFLVSGLDDPRANAVRRHERTGRPLGSEPFVADLEQRLGLRLRPARRGRKPGRREDEGSEANGTAFG
jgi:hypothetical protein